MSAQQNQFDEKLEKKSQVSQREVIGVRAIVIALICLGILAYFQPRAELANIYPEMDVRSTPQPFGMMIILILLCANIILRKVLPRYIFSNREIIAIYCMLMVGGLILSRGLITFAPTTIMAIHMLSIQNSKIYRPFLDRLSEKLIPSGRDAVMGFWRGTSGKVPWNEWILPIIIWTLVYLAGFFLVICLVTIVRRRWTENERLGFPLNQPILAIVGQEQEGEDAINGFWRDHLVLKGMIWPIVYHGLAILHRHFPVIPAISGINLGLMFTEPPFHVLQGGGDVSPWIVFDPSPLIIGIGYLMPANFLFSALLFYVFRLVSYVVYGIQGRYNANTWWMFQKARFSIVVILAVQTLWICRHKIRDIVQAGTRSKSSRPNDEDEPIPYGLAFWGTILVSIGLALFAYYCLGVHPGWTVLFYALAFSGFLVFAKVRAALGYPYTDAGIVDPRFFSQLLGPNWMSVDNTFGLVYLERFMGGGANATLLLESYKFSDQVGLKRRSVTKVMLIVVVFSILVGFVSVLPLFYEYGANSLSYWHIQSGKQWNFDWAETHASDWEASFRKEVAGYVIGGGVITAFLAFMTSRFVWWPIHPLGFYTGLSAWMSYFWAGFLIAWIVKSIVLRYGGYVSFKKLRPAFLGMIVGSVIMNILNVLITFFVVVLG